MREIYKLGVAIAAVALAAGSGASMPTPVGRTVVTTSLGRISGVSGIAGEVTSYKGIRYAAPPIGVRRWQPPQPVGPWSGVYAADRFGPACVQPPSARDTSEDCLFLNVWLPSHKASNKLPVMVWVYGGGFINGAASDAQFDGAALARRGVVVVSLNYRLNTLGFLAHPALTAESAQRTSGNYALLDALAAFEWVQRNIAAFGGDPKRVTAFGESSGGMLLTNALIAPRAKGLFQQVILQSAGPLRQYHGLAGAERVGAKAGPDLAALRATDPNRLPSLGALEGSSFPRPLFAARMSGVIADGQIVPTQQREAFDSGRFRAMPMMIGNNSDEGSYVTRSYPVKTTAEYSTYVAAPVVFGAQAGEAMRLYPAATDAAVPAAVAQSFSDVQYHYGTRGVARAMAARGQPVYRYMFTRKAGGTGPGPNHGDEVAYVFNTLAKRPGFTFNDDDTRVANAMADAWVRFAQTGDPNGGALPAWPRYRREAETYLEFGDVPRVGENFRNAELDFVGRQIDAMKP